MRGEALGKDAGGVEAGTRGDAERVGLAPATTAWDAASLSDGCTGAPPFTVAVIFAVSFVGRRDHGRLPLDATDCELTSGDEDFCLASPLAGRAAVDSSVSILISRIRGCEVVWASRTGLELALLCSVAAASVLALMSSAVVDSLVSMSISRVRHCTVGGSAAISMVISPFWPCTAVGSAAVDSSASSLISRVRHCSVGGKDAVDSSTPRLPRSISGEGNDFGSAAVDSSVSSLISGVCW